MLLGRVATFASILLPRRTASSGRDNHLFSGQSADFNW
jgi:hypothetical protein